MTTYCGNDCCKECDRLSACGGCERDFGIAGLAVDDLNLLTGSYVNLPYPLANGSTVRFLKDDDIYLGNQVERADSDRCYGVVANEDFILVCEYGCNGSDPEIVLYTRR